MWYDSTSRPPGVLLWVVALLAVEGGLAVSFSIAAEITRTQTFSILTDDSGTPLCSYPPSPASGYAIASIFALLATQAVALYFTGFQWCGISPRNHSSNTKTVMVIITVANVAFLLTATGTLLVGALQDGYHILVSTPPPVELSDLQCAVTDPGLFLSGSILAFFSVILMEAAYLIGVRANSEAWLTARYLHSSASMLLDMEAFSRGMVDASVTVVPVSPRDEEEGGEEDMVLTPLRKMA